MPYNIDLEQRLDQLADHLGKFTKKMMFGGVGYLLNGNMVFSIHKQSLVIRTPLERAEEMLKSDAVSLSDSF
jgi:TfoX/Sxy family transcriptional regulator of competence genes